jgi:NitT/TauT family transport system substrate-binding protein
MNTRQADGWTRRRFLGGLTVAGTVGLLSLHPRGVTAEPPPETTRLTLAQTTSLCQAPQYIADALLHGEGFTEVRYVKDARQDYARALAAGEVDLTMLFVGPLLLRLDAGAPVILLGGGHIGCLELFVTARVRTIRDLKGKTVAVTAHGSAPHVFLASIMAYIGLDPRQDIHLVTHAPDEAVRLLEAGQVDAYITSPHWAQELRARQVGRVLVNSSTDRPWSQYFCCMLAGNQKFAREYPMATKRALRAILKAADIWGLEPDRAAQAVVDRGFTSRYDYALQGIQDIPYGKWREYDPEDTVRFYALRLHEVGMIKRTPQHMIAQSTDWRFFNELKKELKG